MLIQEWYFLSAFRFVVIILSQEVEINKLNFGKLKKMILKKLIKSN